jgi:ATP-dependent exoDNAse (exonuclease V) beta subunit
MEEGKILEILKELIATNKTKIKPEILYSYVSGNKKMDVTDNYLKTLDALNKKYITFKRKNNLYDFTDYPLYLLTKMREYGERIETLDALFVDELQDVDEEQFELFKMVDAKKKFFIGDPKQSIYIFRGADSEIFRKLDKFSNKTLLVNYRSFQEITDYADTCYD